MSLCVFDVVNGCGFQGEGEVKGVEYPNDHVFGFGILAFFVFIVAS